MNETWGKESVFNRLLRLTLPLFLLSAVLWISSGYYFQKNIDSAYESVRLAQKAQIESLQMGREQDKFFLQDTQTLQFHRTGEAEEIKNQLAFYNSAKSNMDELLKRVPQTVLPDLKRVRELFDDSYRTFGQLMASYREVGFKNYGLIGEMARALDTTKREIQRLGRSDLELKLSQLKRSELEYYDTRDDLLAQDALKIADELKRSLQALGAKNQGKALHALKQYSDSFRAALKALVLMGGPESGLFKHFYDDVDNTDPAVSKVVSDLEQRVRDEKGDSYLASLAICLGSLLVQFLLMLRLARSISEPLNELREKTVHFREKGEKAVESPNKIAEIHHLDQAFCQLTQNLNKTQQQLVQSQKMESIGTLAGGIAHDFNNLLAGILAYAGILKKRLSADAASVRELGIIEQSAERGAELTRQILGFARKGNYKKEKFDVNKTILECRNLLYRTLDKTVTIKADLGAGLNPIIGDPGQVLQTLMNLGVNARDAMAGGGELMFESQNIEADEPFCKSHGKLRPGSYVRISVSDTGSGIPRHVQEKIFDPFFTTKEVGKGTGLGLSMVYGIMESHGGLVSLYSEVGHGTQFHLYFPAALAEKASPATPTPRPSSRPASSPRLQGVMILVVDDETLMRNVAKDILEAEGATLFLATNGEEACNFLEMNHSIIGIVVMDVIMPKMDGIRATRAIKKLNSSLPIILSSGYSESSSVSQLREELSVGFIQKPFRGEVLITLIETLLSASDALESQSA